MVTFQQHELTTYYSRSFVQAKMILTAAAGMAGAMADADLGFRNQDGGWNARLSGDGSLRVYSSGLNHKWIKARFRGLYEVDTHGTVVCSLTNGTLGGLGFDSLQQGAVTMVSDEVIYPGRPQSETISPCIVHLQLVFNQRPHQSLISIVIYSIVHYRVATMVTSLSRRCWNILCGRAKKCRLSCLPPSHSPNLSFLRLKSPLLAGGR